MSLDTVVEDVREEARARAEEIREQAEAEAEELLAAAREDAEEIREERREEAERTIEQEREQTLSAATLEAKQERLAARRDALAAVREAVEDALAGLSGDRRRELTEALLRGALAEFGDEPVRIYGRGGDAELLEELVADREGVTHGGERDCLGGVVAESDASRVRVDNTFDSVLEEVLDEELKEISDRLFASEAD